MPRIAGPLTISMFLGSFAWSFAFISLPFYIQSISTYDSAATLRWSGWILGISSLVTVRDEPRVGPGGRARRPAQAVHPGAALPGPGVHGDGDRPHAAAALRRAPHPGRDGRGVDPRVHHRGPADRSRGGAPRGGGGAARHDDGTGPGAARRGDGRGARRVPAVVRAGRYHPARVGGLRALGRAPAGAPRAHAARATAGARGGSRAPRAARPGGLEPALLPDRRAPGGAAGPRAWCPTAWWRSAASWSSSRPSPPGWGRSRRRASPRGCPKARWSPCCWSPPGS